MDTPIGSEDSINVEQAVLQRYSQASHAVEPELCCPVQYETRYLEVLPDEIIQRDYGCGDPSRYVNEGETVLDLGSGGGKICYIASQIVGSAGHVYGVDMNDDMLALARKYQAEVAGRIGWDNVTFHKAKIQDLQLDVDRFDQWLSKNQISGIEDWSRAQTFADELRAESPVIADESIDVVLSNCVLNLVREDDRIQLFAEIFRVLRRGGRAVISDIVSDEFVPPEMKNDPKLWSGCISGAFVEDRFLQAFEQAGFYGLEIVSRQSEPWAIINGIEFRSVTVQAYKGKDGPCLDGHQAVIYKGPWKSVTDDEGHVLRRGERIAVCEKNFELYTKAPYLSQIEPVQPVTPVSSPKQFDCHDGTVRNPQQTKLGSTVSSSTGMQGEIQVDESTGKNKSGITILPDGDCCGPTGCC